MLLGALLDAGAPVADARRGDRGARSARPRPGRRRTCPARRDRRDPGARDRDRPGSGSAGIGAHRDGLGGPLPAIVRERSLDALSRIANVEASIHGADPADVHLHELGGLDTLLDVCGVFVLLHALGIDRLVCSPLPYTRGTIGTLPGPLPTPGPATLELLRGAPLVGTDAGDELVTPTGAAIVAVAADGWGELPALTLDAVGYGAGSRELPDRPNVLRVVIGRAAEQAAATTQVVLLEANLDDLVPELIPDAVQRCSEAGALDVWIDARADEEGPAGHRGERARASRRRARGRRGAPGAHEHARGSGLDAAPVRAGAQDRRRSRSTVVRSGSRSACSTAAWSTWLPSTTTAPPSRRRRGVR